MNSFVAKMIDHLRLAQSVVLTTHRQSDGDGLGAQWALYYALQKLGKQVRLINVDAAPRKYSFLGPREALEVYAAGKTSLPPVDLAIGLDTNDPRLLEPLFGELKVRAKRILFIDHHQILSHGPQPPLDSLVDLNAASTGEICYRLIKALGVEFDAEIARALYTSVVFDTHLFRYIKSAPSSHLMAADLLKYERNPEEVHRNLFANYTVYKLKVFIRNLERVEYFAEERIAFVTIGLDENSGVGGLERDESGDVIDHVMNIASVEVAALLREDGPECFKLSLRSRGKIEVLTLAESLGGGGHRFASGAYMLGPFEKLRERVLQGLGALLPIAISIGRPVELKIDKKVGA